MPKETHPIAYFSTAPVLLVLLLVLTGCSLPNVQLPPLTFSEESESQTEANEQAVAAEPTTPPEPTATVDPTLPTATPLPEVPPQPTIGPEFSDALSAEETLLQELYSRSNPAVVSIEVIGNLAEQLDLPDGHPLAPGGSGNVPLSGGSGFLYDSQGHIVTNNHVIEDAERLQVTFYDGSQTTARLIGTDPGSDLAVIKVDQLPPNAAPLPIGDSREVAVGQTAIAIGNPFGLQNTLTVGVVSGLGRSLTGPPSENGAGFFSIPNIIQSDAAINPGNSGGPLLNTRGEVVGVNTAIASTTGQFNGVGYAVPSQVLQRVVPSLIETGEYAHPWIGISMVAVDPLLAEEARLSVQNGVLVTGVSPNSPANNAGLQAGEDIFEYLGAEIPINGDIIVAVNGTPIRNSDELLSFLQVEVGVGDTLTLTVIRNGQEQELPLTLAARP